MIRTIDGFHRDGEGDWIAELSCLHHQHVRHRPPFWDRPWVVSEAGRQTRLGSTLDCPLCDRAELPPGLERVRTAGPFDQATLPTALQRPHRIGGRTWGLLRVLDGTLGFTMDTEPPVRTRLQAGDDQPIPPGVQHELVIGEPFRLVVDFLVRPSAQTFRTPWPGGGPRPPDPAHP